MDKSRLLMKKELVKLIESHLGWGIGSNWTNKEFEELSERIFDSTQKQVSVTTLKRIWGRAEQVGNPSIVTLDILTEFVNYKSWRHFLQENESTSFPKSIVRKISYSIIGRTIAGIMVLLVLSSLIWYSFYDQNSYLITEPNKISPDSIEFSFEKVAIGYPNTVIFNYNLANVSYDSLFIQQDWDKRKQITLTEPQGLVTSTYYYPGYFSTKLIVNDKIVKEKDLYIPTSGWQGYIPISSKKVIYLKPEQVLNDTTLRISPDAIQQINKTPRQALCLTYLSDSPHINSLNFSLETEFRLYKPTEKSMCKKVNLVVTGTKDILGLQFSIPGCVGDLSLFINKKMISGKKHDLSSFGLNLQEWVNCKLEVKDQQLVIFVNNQQIFSHPLTVDLGNIGGVKWAFEGLGEIRSLQITDQDSSMDLLHE